jgi:DnaJ homologue, subfamily C, member 28, conserved domain
VEYLHRLVEERIQKAQENGIFDNLPGKGKPLALDDDSLIPEDLRLTYKVLKNANCLPIEMELRKEIFNLQQLLSTAVDPETRREIRRDLNLRILHFNLRRTGAATNDLAQS